MQVLSNKPVVETAQHSGSVWVASYSEACGLVNTDVDSVKSEDFRRIEVVDQKQTSTIGKWS